LSILATDIQKLGPDVSLTNANFERSEKSTLFLTQCLVIPSEARKLKLKYKKELTFSIFRHYSFFASLRMTGLSRVNIVDFSLRSKWEYDFRRPSPPRRRGDGESL